MRTTARSSVPRAGSTTQEKGARTYARYATRILVFVTARDAGRPKRIAIAVELATIQSIIGTEALAHGKKQPT